MQACAQGLDVALAPQPKDAKNHTGSSEAHKQPREPPAVAKPPAVAILAQGKHRRVLGQGKSEGTLASLVYGCGRLHATTQGIKDDTGDTP